MRMKSKNKMNKKKEIVKAQIQTAIADYCEELTVSNYFKKKLATNYKNTKTTNAEKLVDNMIEKALTEEEPNWTNTIFNLASKSDEKAATNNVQVNISNFLDQLKD